VAGTVTELDDSRVAAYRADFQVARDEIFQLYLLRHVWKNLQGMLGSRQDMYQDPLVHNWITTCYTRTLAVGIRRQTDRRRPRATIGSLLHRIEADAASFTRKSLGFGAADTGPSAWLKFADSDNDALDPTKVRAVISSLMDAELVARTWVNKRIAHLDPEPMDPPEVTFDDLERALRGLRQGTVFLHALFHQGGTLWQLTPIVNPRWLNMFLQSWFIEGKTMPIEPTMEDETGIYE